MIISKIYKKKINLDLVENLKIQIEIHLVKYITGFVIQKK